MRNSTFILLQKINFPYSILFCASLQSKCKTPLRDVAYEGLHAHIREMSDPILHQTVSFILTALYRQEHLWAFVKIPLLLYLRVWGYPGQPLWLRSFLLLILRDTSKATTAYTVFLTARPFSWVVLRLSSPSHIHLLSVCKRPLLIRLFRSSLESLQQKK